MSISNIPSGPGLGRVWLWRGCLLGLVSTAQAVDKPEIILSGAWDSAYVSEGRDHLSDGGLVSGTFELAWRGFGLSGWSALGDSTDYREHNFGVGYSLALGPVGMTVAYTRLEFGGAGEGPGDNEFALGLSVPVPGAIELAVGARYSTEADGTFGEVSLRRPWETGRAGIVLTPYLMYGLDYGYASAGHDGPNHLEGGLLLECPLADAAVLSIYCTRCWAQRDVRLEGGDDVTWGGVRLALMF